MPDKFVSDVCLLQQRQMINNEIEDQTRSIWHRASMLEMTVYLLAWRSDEAIRDAIRKAMNEEGIF